MFTVVLAALISGVVEAELACRQLKQTECRAPRCIYVPGRLDTVVEWALESYDEDNDGKVSSREFPADGVMLDDGKKVSANDFAGIDSGDGLDSSGLARLFNTTETTPGTCYPNLDDCFRKFGENRTSCLSRWFFPGCCFSEETGCVSYIEEREDICSVEIEDQIRIVGTMILEVGSSDDVLAEREAEAIS
eukprot:TRINITY_DN13231_c0_g1_i2.p1 TRINITY_DN13231_c0_g1~~TRINITY_DN13231_c0_g1_i2.p1  ORF type:complete len:191 (+),score=38.65 TRINITY_DN13231_c0_g1_i2:3-575(+)